MKVFHDWQYCVKRKARNIFVQRNLTGGGLPYYEYLTDLELRLLSNIGKIVVEGIQEVQELGLTVNFY